MPDSSAARTGRALLGVVVGVACLAGSTAVARADVSSDAPSVIEFTVPNRAAIDKLQNLGFDLAEYQCPADDGGIVIDAVVDRQEELQLLAMGYEEGKVVETPQQDAAVRAQADAAVAAKRDAFANLSRQPGDGRRRQDHKHGCPDRQRDQCVAGRVGAGDRPDVPQRRGQQPCGRDPGYAAD